MPQRPPTGRSVGAVAVLSANWSSRDSVVAINQAPSQANDLTSQSSGFIVKQRGTSRLANDSPSFTPVHSRIKANGLRNLHLAKGRGPAGRYWYQKLLVVNELVRKQRILYHSDSRSIPHRIVSLYQAHIRPIVRGKARCQVEFGAKISISVTGDGFAFLDRLSYGPYNEGEDLKAQATAYRRRQMNWNRCVIFSSLMPLEEMEQTYATQFSRTAGAPAMSVRLAFGALFIKQLVGLMGKETVEQIRKYSPSGSVSWPP